MVGQKKEECFKKTLTKSDIDVGLEITGGAANLPPGDEEMRVFDQNERVWRFKVGTRKDGRRFMKNQWLRFVEEADLNIGDTLTYYHLRKLGDSFEEILMASTNSSVSYVPIFDGENYDFWCVKMKTFFVSQDLWDLVESGFAEPESTATLTQDQAKALKENIQRDAKALNQIQEGISNSIFPRIMRATRSNQAWEILQQEYQGDLKVRTIKLQNLRRDFETMKMKENETLNDFSTRFSKLVKPNEDLWGRH
ncbi:hypothetical protein F0562_030325 [Nyssa sinensis]|uniref:TF-B3 domain-containing protein n=1 Tax=Nyssa sinensis TaxID=561372 RepID=A0A5J5B083_9ASTE|nr:hypothetical protein F0562_030325 [Nyssa sinensis]